MQINFFKREVSCKLVYYGPGMSGKTTNLHMINEKTPDNIRSKLTSIATEGERTLFFDYMPLNLRKVGGMNTKFQLYTVPGQIYYNSTRKLVLQGVDGLVFVADSRKEKLKENVESLQNLEDNLKELGISIQNIPLVIQWNKRDDPNAADIDFLEKNINRYGIPTTKAVAAAGDGVIHTLKLIASLVLENLNKKQSKLASAAPPSTRVPPHPIAGAGMDEENIVVMINDARITKSYFNNFCQLQYRLHTKDHAVENFKKPSKEEQEVLMDRLINHYLIVQESKKRGITAGKKEIDDKLRQYTKRFRTEAEFKAHLSDKKLTVDNIRNEIFINIIMNKMIKILMPHFQKKLIINDDELEEYRAKHNVQLKKISGQNRDQVIQILNKEKKSKLIQELFDIVRRDSVIIKT